MSSFEPNFQKLLFEKVLKSYFKKPSLVFQSEIQIPLLKKKHFYASNYYFKNDLNLHFENYYLMILFQNSPFWKTPGQNL
jgi:hypothetical protein